MKKTIFLMIIAVAALFASCEKDEVGGTATESMAGEWYVNLDLLDENGDVWMSGEDFYGISRFLLLTYNTAANVETEMWVDDLANFWEFQVKVDIDQSTLTFSTDGEVANNYYDCNVTITDGKILYGATTTPSGAVADSIVFKVSFDDDPYPAYYGFSEYLISGFRYTGLDNDD